MREVMKINRKHEKADLKLISINFTRIGFDFAGSSSQSHSQSTLVSNNIPVPSLSIPFNWIMSLYKELQPCFFCFRCPTSFRGNVPQQEQCPCSCGKGLQRFTLELQSPKNTPLPHWSLPSSHGPAVSEAETMLMSWFLTWVPARLWWGILCLTRSRHGVNKPNSFCRKLRRDVEFIPYV